jgi:hypothetical protein
MRKNKKDAFRLLMLLWLGSLFVSLSAFAQGESWLDPWEYRRAVAIDNPCGSELTDFQVAITLDNTFDFEHALPDGSDIRITADDGVTVIPFWIENWEPSAPSPQAGIWAKVPSIPVSGTTVYLYYGNPSPPGPELVEVPPVGPWDKQTTNIIPIGDPDTGSALLGENIVYDDVTGHYWLLFAAYRGASSVGLVYSDTPDDPTSWYWHGIVVTAANAPHIIEYDGLWYIFYADRTTGPPYPISVDTSSSIEGPYAWAATVLTSTEPWEAYRVDEPYVFQRNDGKWILMYMGDAGSTTELIGYAEADDILGPYTKFSGNPCLPFGPPGSIDAGTVADPWVVEFHGVYYIGYTVSPTKSSPWRTAIATTEDWVNFTKHGIILDLGGPGDWDERNAFRGAVTRFGDTYYFPYTGRRTGGPYVMGMATQPAYMPESLNDADEVFEFIDTFDGDFSKWVISHSGSGSSASIAGGILTMTGVPGSYVQMRATTGIGTETLLEAYAMHTDAGLNPGSTEGNAAAEVGYKPSDMSWSNVTRIMDWPDLEKYCIQSSAGSNNSGYVPTEVDFDADWHTYRVYRTDDGYAGFQIDANAFEYLGPPYVPTIDLYPWLMSYSRSTAPQSRFNVDWIRVRKWCGADAVAVIGDVEQPVGTISGLVFMGSDGLMGVIVELLNDGGGVILASTATDENGCYMMEDVANGDYLVNLRVPVGFAPVTGSTVPVTVAGDDLEVDFELQDASSGKTTDLWWWKRQFQAIYGGNPLFLGITRDDVDAYCLTVFEHFYNRGDAYAIQIEEVTYIDDPPRAMDFDDIYDIFFGPYDPSNAAGAREHLLIVLLNVASGRLSQLAPVSVDGATASQAITYFSDRYLVAGNTDWTIWFNLMKIHLKWQIGAGVIPLSVPNIMFKRDVPGGPMLPADFALSQNYPNPFNPVTEIALDLPYPADVSVEIFNVNGQKVRTLINNVLPAGRHVVEWDGTGLFGEPVASGLYLYRMRTGTFVETRKMLLLK